MAPLSDDKHLHILLFLVPLMLGAINPCFDGLNGLLIYLLGHKRLSQDTTLWISVLMTGPC
jgi:hypothetical protein